MTPSGYTIGGTQKSLGGEMMARTTSIAKFGGNRTTHHVRWRERMKCDVFYFLKSLFVSKITLSRLTTSAGYIQI